jgi:hypothetical protein
MKDERAAASRARTPAGELVIFTRAPFGCRLCPTEFFEYKRDATKHTMLKHPETFR